MIEIKQVGSKKDLKAFARFAVDVLYRDCKLYVPSLYADELSVLNPKKNFSLEHCEVRCFLAYKDGKIAGRIAGIVQNKYNEISGRKCIRFSRFDCIDDAEVAKALLAAVEAFGKALLGHKVGDMVEVEAPIGVLKYKILTIEK